MSLKLKERFIPLLQNLGANSSHAESAWQELSQMYQEEERHYHTLTHIDHMLSQMEQYVPDSLQSVELELAIWYHDVVYDAKSHENEANSAALCSAVLKNINSLSTESLAIINSLIMSTHGHKVLLEGPKRAVNELMLDLDLCILGLNWDRYAQYSREIRQEYIHIPLEAYKTGRSLVMRSFLTRNEIYFSKVFKDLYEEQARENLNRELMKLGKRR